MDPADVRFLFGYDRFATEKVLAQLADVDPNLWGAVGVVGDRGLGAILVHMLGAHQRWRLGLLDSPDMPRPEHEPLPTPAELVERWKLELDAMTAFLARVTPEFLDETGEGGITVAVMLQHLANHGTQHRSEAALLLTQAARSPGDLDMYDYAEAVAAGALSDPRLAEGR